MPDTGPSRVPDPFTIPSQAIREWVQLSQTQPLDIQFSRATIDHLFFALSKMIEAQSKFQTCLIHYSRGDLVGADGLLAESQVSLAESDNRLRQFMTDIMLSATRGR